MIRLAEFLIEDLAEIEPMHDDLPIRIGKPFQQLFPPCSPRWAAISAQASNISIVSVMGTEACRCRGDRGRKSNVEIVAAGHLPRQP
jgi:hypothetical protein